MLKKTSTATYIVFLSCFLVFTEIIAYANHTPENIHEKTYNETHLAAVEMARTGDYVSALKIIEKLMQQYANPPFTLLYDYIAILEWSGQHQKAVDAFNKQPPVFQNNMPPYVKEALANAFYKIGDYNKALALYEGGDITNSHLQKQKAQLFLGLLKLDEVTPDTQLSFALDLAKTGSFDKALTIYQNFYQAQQLSATQLYDYITVLSWSGQEQAASKLFEQQKIPADSLPDYMLLNMGNIYTKLLLTDKAKNFYQIAAQHGNKEAKLALASILLNQGANLQVLDIANDSIREAPEQPDGYILRAKAYLASGKVFDAAMDYEKALSCIPLNDSSRRQQIIAEQAVFFLRAGEYAYSIELLAPYIKNENATIYMQCDYVYALQLNESYKAGLDAAQKMWPDITVIPAYGLLAAGNCALALGKENIALGYYNQIAKSSSAEKETALNKIAQIKK